MSRNQFDVGVTREDKRRTTTTTSLLDPLPPAPPASTLRPASSELSPNSSTQQQSRLISRRRLIDTMSSAWRSYLSRSMEHLRDRSSEVLRAQPSPTHKTVLPLLSLRSSSDVSQFVLGCDGDLGGMSTVNLDLGPEGKGRFWGSLSSQLREGRRKDGVIERGGYAGMRSKSRTTVFGPRTWDTSLYDFLRLRVRSSGDGMRYFINIQTDGPVRSDLFQHRLWLPSPASDEAPHEWTDVLIPFSDFTLTNSGDLSELQIEMLRTKVRTVGISVLGPAEGRYELGIEAIDAVSLEGESRPRKESLESLDEKGAAA